MRAVCACRLASDAQKVKERKDWRRGKRRKTVRSMTAALLIILFEQGGERQPE